MIYVTHDQVEAMTLADQIVVMRDGQIVQQGAAGHLRPALQYLRRPLYRLPADESPCPVSAPCATASSAAPAARCGFRWPNAGIRAVAQQGDAPLIVGLRLAGYFCRMRMARRQR